MKSKLIQTGLLAVVAAALAFSPAITRAADTNTPAVTETKSKKMMGALPFHGAVSAVDANGMSFTVGTLTISVTSKTTIKKEGEPATFADIAVGEKLTGSYKKDAEGKLTAGKVNILAKAKETKKKAE